MIKADLTELISLFKLFKSENKARSKLFTFWVEYSSIVTSLLRFLKVERTGNWKLHLFSIVAMVTYFIARDRQKYIPYLPVYLANMQQLELTHLDVYEDFNAGNHSINCTGQPFSQVSTDIALELLINTDSKLKGVVIPILHSPSALEWFFPSITSALKVLYGLQDGSHTTQKEAVLIRINQHEGDIEKMMGCFSVGLLTDPLIWTYSFSSPLELFCQKMWPKTLSAVSR